MTAKNALTIDLTITNASNISKNIYFSENNTTALVKLYYTPNHGEYPSFVFNAYDAIQDLKASSSQTGILICDCKSLDTNNQCLFGSVLSYINPMLTFVSCDCLQYYKGKRNNRK